MKLSNWATTSPFSDVIKKRFLRFNIISFFVFLRSYYVCYLPNHETVALVGPVETIIFWSECGKHFPKQFSLKATRCLWKDRKYFPFCHSSLSQVPLPGDGASEAGVRWFESCAGKNMLAKAEETTGSSPCAFHNCAVFQELSWNQRFLLIILMFLSWKWFGKFLISLSWFLALGDLSEKRLISKENVRLRLFS